MVTEKTYDNVIHAATRVEYVMMIHLAEMKIKSKNTTDNDSNAIFL